MPWLAAIGRWIDAQRRRRRSAVVSCSALKRAYRDTLRAGRPQVRFLYLRGEPAEIAERLRARRDHFMPPQLLASQFPILEEPEADEPAWTIAIDGRTPDEVLDLAIERVRLRV